MSRKDIFYLFSCILLLLVMVAFVVFLYYMYTNGYNDMTERGGCTYSPWTKVWTCPASPTPTVGK